MKTTLTRLVGMLLCAASVSVFAARPLTLTLDPAAAGPGKFAAEEIRREAAARGLTVVDADGPAPADAIGIALKGGGPAAQTAHLGRYYAAKIRGACALALFDLNGQKVEQESSLRHLGEALAHWRNYAAIRDGQYVLALYNRLGVVNITALTENVAADLAIARGWKTGTLKDDGRRSGTEKGFRK